MKGCGSLLGKDQVRPEFRRDSSSTVHQRTIKENVACLPYPEQVLLERFSRQATRTQATPTTSSGVSRDVATFVDVVDARSTKDPYSEHVLLPPIPEKGAPWALFPSKWCLL